MVTVKETEAIPCYRAAKQIAREALVGMAVTPCHAVIAERKPGWRMLEKAYARLAKQRVRAYRGDKYRQWLDANGGL